VIKVNNNDNTSQAISLSFRIRLCALMTFK